MSTTVLAVTGVVEVGLLYWYWLSGTIKFLTFNDRR